METIRREYERALEKKKELAGEARDIEKTRPGNIRELWIARDRMAYWEGRAEGLRFALDELEKGAAEK